jgi:hypothetical protein
MDNFQKNNPPSGVAMQNPRFIFDTLPALQHQGFIILMALFIYEKDPFQHFLISYRGKARNPYRLMQINFHLPSLDARLLKAAKLF